MIGIKKASLGLFFASAFIAHNAYAETLTGKYECLHKAMDINFTLIFEQDGKYTQDIEFVGIEKGNYSSDGKVFTFTPTENTRGGKKIDMPSTYKRNIISNVDKELILTNLDSDDKIICKK